MNSRYAALLLSGSGTRGLERSEKTDDPAAYLMPMLTSDAVAVLDELGIDRAHFVGMSWGGRLGFGIGEHALDRAWRSS